MRASRQGGAETVRPLSLVAPTGVLFFFAAALVSTLLAPASGATEAAAGAGAEVGTVETIAGPDYCVGPAKIDQASTDLRGLAVDRGGRIHAEVGRPEQGLVMTVEGDRVVSLVGTGLPGLASGGQRQPTSSVSSAGRLASDGAGGVLVAAGVKVLQLGPGLQPVAGDGNAAPDMPSSKSTGDGGPALDARFKAIRSMASDEGGNLYVADEIDPSLATFRIRFFNRSASPITFYGGTAHQLTVGPGKIDTIAGAEGTGMPSDSGAAREATLGGVSPALAVAGHRLYIASSGGGPRSLRARASVRMINFGSQPTTAHGVPVSPGGVAVVAGGADTASSPPARGAAKVPSHVPGITADGDGNLFLVDEDNQRIQRLDAAGALSTFAGTGVRGFNGNDRSATGAQLNRPYDVKSGPGGRIYVSDRGNGQLRYVDRAGIIHAAPGNGAAMSWRCIGPKLSTGSPDVPVQGLPAGVAVDGNGRVYFGLSRMTGLKMLDPPGTVAPVPLRSDGATAEGLPSPIALTAGPRGELYVLGSDGELRSVNIGPSGVDVHAFGVAGGGLDKVGDEGGPPGPGQSSIAADGRGTVVIADGARLRTVDDTGRVAVLIEPEPDTAQQGKCCSNPTGVTIDDRGNLYVVDRRAGGPRVWYLNRGSRPATVLGRMVGARSAEVVAGNGARGSGGDGGPAIEAELSFPTDTAVDSDGALYILDSGENENTIRKVDPDGTIGTVVGTGQYGFNGDGLKGRLTALSQPTAIAFDGCGNLLIAERGSGRFRRLNLSGSCHPRVTQAATQPRPLRSIAVAVFVLLVATVVTGIAVRRGRGRTKRDTGSEG